LVNVLRGIILPFFRRKKEEKKEDKYSKLKIQDVLDLILGDYTLEQVPGDKIQRWYVDLVKMVKKKVKGRIELTLEGRQSLQIFYNEYESEQTFDLYLVINVEDNKVIAGCQAPSVMTIARILPFIHQFEEVSIYGIEFSFGGQEIKSEYFAIKYPEELRISVDESNIPEDKKRVFENIKFLRRIYMLIKKDPPENLVVDKLLKDFENYVIYLLDKIEKQVTFTK